MLTKKQILEIRKHLEKAQNPIFFFDNDADGLCSFLLLQRFIGRGKGIPIRSFPELDKDYFKRINELNADYIFILDKPVISQGFWDEIEQINMPVVWIDHHEIQDKVPKFVNYFNPLYNKKKNNEPVSFLCYQVNDKFEDLWISFIGCISDRFVPDFYAKFEKQYPDLIGEIKNPDAFDILYCSKLGRISKLLSAGLKNRTTEVINMIKLLTKVKTPYEILNEDNKNGFIHKRFEHINSKYVDLVNKAKEGFDDKKKFLFFQYAGDLSMSGELSNELSYCFPEKFIFVVYVKGSKANVSGRGKNVRDLLLRVIESIDGANGGGHENAVGARINVEDIENFREKIEKELEN